MTPPKAGGDDLQALLEAYRAFAQADADARFDEGRLEVQRQHILDRLAHLGQTAKVIPFPAALHGAPVSSINRRWVSAAAAAGLIIGLVTGQFLQVVSPRGTRARQAEQPAVSAPARAAETPAEDDGLLGEVDSRVQLRTAAELRVLDELTPFHDPR